MKYSSVIFKIALLYFILHTLQKSATKTASLRHRGAGATHSYY